MPDEAHPAGQEFGQPTSKCVGLLPRVPGSEAPLFNQSGFLIAPSSDGLEVCEIVQGEIHRCRRKFLLIVLLENERKLVWGSSG